MQWIKKYIYFTENSDVSISSWLVSFIAIICLRLILENVVLKSFNQSLINLLGSFLHMTLFFAFGYFIILLYLFILKTEDIQKLISFLLWGQWIIIIPPIIDKLIFKDKEFYSFYIFDSFRGTVSRLFHFFGDSPHFGITYGTRAEVFLVLVFLSGYYYFKKRNLFKMILFATGLYLILFALGAFPSYLAMLMNLVFPQYQAIGSIEIAKIFFSPLRFFNFELWDQTSSLHFKMSLFFNLLLFIQLVVVMRLWNAVKLKALLANIRVPQVIFNEGLLLIGVALGLYYHPISLKFDWFSFLALLNCMLAVFCGWYFSVFINDIHDIKIDQITNQNRPLVKKIFSIKEYLDLALVIMVFSLSSALIINGKVFFLLLSYHFLTYVYSAQPFRLKRIIGVASLLSAIASLLFFIVGFSLTSPSFDLDNMPWRVALLLLIGYSLAIPIKDLKDTQGDKNDGVYTLPVLVGQENAKLILATTVFLCYFLSAYIINEKRLFLPALLFGGASYGVISNQKINPRKLNWLVLGLVFLYGLVLVKISLL